MTATDRARAPAAWARAAVEWSAWRLPVSQRQRYRQELVSELYGMSPGQQLRQVMGVLAMTHSLRQVLLARETARGAASPRTDRSWSCRLGRHAWVARGNELGEHFLECRRCRAFRDPNPITGPIGRGPASG